MNTASLVASVSRQAGGLFESVRRLHQELALLPDISVKVLSLQDAYTSQDLPHWAPLEVQTFKASGPARFGYCPELTDAVLALDYDILHTHGLWMYPSVATSKWYAETRRPYVVSPHGMLDPWAVRNSSWKKRLALLFYESKHLRNAACIRALNVAEARAIRSAGLKNPVCIIPNGIDLPAVTERAESCAQQRGGRRKKLLLYLGRLHPKKGLPNLLRAWASLPDRKEWILGIVGWDQNGHQAQLTWLCSQLNLSYEHLKDDARPDDASPALPGNGATPSVLFSGPRHGSAKARCFLDSDAFVLPSVSEGLPMVILEAWAYAKPVLMTPACNIPSGFSNGAAIKIGSEEATIRMGLQQLLRMSDGERESMGKRGRTLVAKEHNWQQIVSEVHSLYLWLLGSSPRPACIWNG